MANKKVNARREAYAKKQEKQGQKVIAWIAAGLIIVALLYLFWVVGLM